MLSTKDFCKSPRWNGNRKVILGVWIYYPNTLVLGKHRVHITPHAPTHLAFSISYEKITLKMHLHTLLHVLNEAASGLKLTMSIEFSLFSIQTDISLNKVAPTDLLNYLAGKYVIFLEKIWSLPINGKCRWLVNISDWVKTGGAIVCLRRVVGTLHFQVLELRRDLHFK